MIISRHRHGAGRTPGIYGHLPKFWNCKGHYQDDRALNYNPFSMDMGGAGLLPEILEGRIASRDYHATHKWRWHLTYRGYLRLVTKKKMYTVWYMGNEYRPGNVFERHTMEASQ